MLSLNRSPGNTLDKKLLSGMEIFLKTLQEIGSKCWSTLYLTRNQEDNTPQVMNKMELALLKKRLAQSSYHLDLLTRKLNNFFCNLSTARKIYLTI